MAGLRRFRGSAAALGGLLLAVTAINGCCSPSLGGIVDQIKLVSGGTSKDFAVVAVSSRDRAVFPDQLIVRKDLHGILWVCDKDLEAITFVDPGLPTPICRGGKYCYLLISPPVSPAAEAGAKKGYKYTIKIKGQPVIDPRMEVVL